MSRWVTILVLLFTACAQKTPQTVLHNQPPWRELNLAIEVYKHPHLGWGAPIIGNRVLTVEHLGEGQPDAHWRWRMFEGDLTLLWSDKDKDLALYQMGPQNAPNVALEFSKERPMLGEEVYWNTHTWNGKRGMGRGWVVALEKSPPSKPGNKPSDFIVVHGFHHPGTSGSPVLRADGTLIGIAMGGANWSCGAPWSRFKKLDLAEKLECLYRRDAFTPEMLIVSVVGGFK